MEQSLWKTPRREGTERESSRGERSWCFPLELSSQYSSSGGVIGSIDIEGMGVAAMVPE